MPELARDRLGGGAAVAGQHDDRAGPRRAAAASASGVEALIGSATPSRPGGCAVDGDEHHRLAVARAAPRPRAARAPGSTPSVVQQRAIAERDRAAVDRARRRPCPVTRLEIRRRRRARSSAARAPRDDRGGQRVLAAALEARGQPQQLGLVDAAAGDRPSTSRGLPSVSVPVLSTTSVSTFSQHLERLGVLDQHAGVRAAPGADHDRHRRGQPERARAGDDQHGDGVDERVGQPRLRARRAPRRRTSTHGDGDDGRHEVAATPCRRAAGSARGCAAPRPPCGRSARAACRAPTRSARITKLPVPLTVAAGHAVARRSSRPGSARR